jgi:hypothetical protein
MQRIVALLSWSGLLLGAWQAGVARVDITPSEPIFLAGYGGRTEPSDGVTQRIWVKALALRDDTGAVSVLTTSDLVGLDRNLLEYVRGRIKSMHGIPAERILFNYSHNHSCPVTGDVLKLYYVLTEPQKAAVDRYTRLLHSQYVDVIGRAVKDMAPATIAFEQGLAGFAVNRRRSRPGARKLPGPVDHDVPVLTVRTAENRLKAVAFGYSCHATALSGTKVNGDYPGFAQEELEKKYPGSTAMFVMGCGGDANPLPRIMNSNGPEAYELASMYGRILASAAKLVVERKMIPVEGPIRAAIGFAEIPFQKAPQRGELVANQKKFTGARLRYNNHLLSELEREGKLPDRYPYPVQVWRFGSGLTMIGLTGEPVIDYCLRFKSTYPPDSTWVLGYNNELLSYIPSLRVLKEGGYEGTEAIPEYGLPAPYGWAVEEAIAGKVEELYRSLE